LHQNHQILVIQDNETNKIIGSITILVENKLIHDIGKVCHVEDLVIDHAYRGKGLRKILINTCINISKNMGCYKTILNCSPTNILFYEKCNFKQMNAQMSLYN
jgi:glucosamine-phosphate N-acetyltransferase